MRRRAGVLGLVIAVLAVLWWWHGSRETAAPETASKGAVTVASHGARAQAKTATLGGRVTRAKDGTPIEGATVSIVSTDVPLEERVPRIIVTGSDGVWTLPSATGSYNVSVVADGFLPARRAGIVLAELTSADVSVALVEGGATLRGVVSDIGGGPIGGALVIANTDGVDFTALTNVDGSYRLTLDPSYYDLTIRHEGYVTKTDWMTLWTLPMVKNVSLVPSGTIRGVVVARDTNQPIANAVVIVGASHKAYDGTAETDEHGAFVLHDVPAGDFPLYASARGYVTIDTTVVNLGVGDTAETRLVADRGYTLRGRVTRKSQPSVGVANVTVLAHTDEAVPDARTHTVTRADGTFEILGLAPAHYTLTATGPGILTVTDVHVVVKHADTVVAISATTGVTLRGRIDPPEQARVSIIDQRRYGVEADAHINVEADGSFAITNVGPGDLIVSASSPTKSGSTMVTVGEKDQSGLIVVLRPTPSHSVISGTVVDEANTPIAKAYVDASGESTFAGDDGTFELHGQGRTPIYATYGVADPPRDHVPVMTVVADKDIRGLIVRLPGTAGEIRGRVVGGDGTPASDVWVSTGNQMVLTGMDGTFVLKPLRKGTYELRAATAREDARSVVHKVDTGSNVTIVLEPSLTLHGRVTQDGAPVTQYELQCDGNAYYERRINSADGAFTIDHVHPADDNRFECRAVTEQAEGHANPVFTNTAATVVIELVPFATVTGEVLDVFTKHPVSDATVRIAGRALGVRLFDSASQVDPNGRFTLSHAPAEDVVVQVRMASMWATRSVHAGAAKTLDVGAILVIPPPQHAADLKILIDPNLTIDAVNESQHVGLRAGDKIIAIDGIDASVLPWGQWAGFFEGGAERGQSYALTLARGVTVNVTAE